jgi:SAM-dependent methyltransferase
MAIQFDFQNRTFLLNAKPIEIVPEIAAKIKNSRWWFKPYISNNDHTEYRVDVIGEAHNFHLDKINFSNKKILNLGCRDGFLAFLAEALGAERVVAIEDLPSRNNYRESFQLMSSLLNSKVEYFEVGHTRLSDFINEKFDIVIVNESLCYSDSPLEYLRQIHQIAQSEVLLVSHYIEEHEDIPRMVFYRNWAKEGDGQAVWGPNVAWYKNVLDSLGFHIQQVRVLGNERTLSLLLSKQVSKASSIIPSIADLSTDHGHENNTAILLMSCQRYEQLWDPFFILLKRYWPDCPYKIYFCTDFGRYPGVETIEVGKDLGWVGNCKYALNKIQAARVILFQEDFLLTGKVDTITVHKLVKHAHDSSAACLRIMPVPGPSDTWLGCKDIGIIGPTDEYKMSLQLAIWDKKVLEKLLLDNESPWQLEVIGTRRAAMRPEPFLSISKELPVPVPYYVTAVVKGEWQEAALELLDKEGIPRAHIRRKL